MEQAGGLYFIEDMQVSRDLRYEDTDGQFIMAEVIKDWIEQLIIPSKSIKQNNLRRRGAEAVSDQGLMWRHKIPSDINWITCQMEACVISKCIGKGGVRCSR
mmetsp:Transcript_5410/g.8918  ORF Transcript_5410/g.8918 Transcript_5410/m.8918 type:complete len:102 (+) Transcript_5410:35-340(+)